MNRHPVAETHRSVVGRAAACFGHVLSRHADKSEVDELQVSVLVKQHVLLKGRARGS
jgi:D-tyrosyl-tRNA(Tyr) deacylase